MIPDLNKYWADARALCASNRAKWGEQNDMVLYCVLSEQWGQFVRAINRWRFPGRGGSIEEVTDTAVKALAVMVDLDCIRDDDTHGPEEMDALAQLLSFGWHCHVMSGHKQMSEVHRVIHLRATITAMLWKALDENEKGVKS